MSFDYIEKAYGRKFYRGQIVVALGKLGVVVKADHHVHVRIEGRKHTMPYHPSDVEQAEPVPAPSSTITAPGEG